MYAGFIMFPIIVKYRRYIPPVELFVSDWSIVGDRGNENA